MAFTLAHFLSCRIWFLSGLYKLTHFKQICEDMAKHGIPCQARFLLPTIALEIGGGLIALAALDSAMPGWLQTMFV
jgi:hypothetical protein